MHNDDKYFAYAVLSKAFGDSVYVQREHWTTDCNFKLDPILTSPEYLLTNYGDQCLTAVEANKFPTV